MPPGDERQQAWRKAVRAFDLAAAALANPVPKLLTDLTDPEKSMRDLQQDLPLAYFSPFGTLPEDIAPESGEPVHSPDGAPPTPDSLAGHENIRSDTGSALVPGGADDLSRATPPGAGSPVSPFRRGYATGATDEDAARGRFHVPGTSPEEPVDSAYRKPANASGTEDSALGALLFGDPMSLLGGLAENALEAVETRNTPPQATRSRRPGRGAHDNETAAPVHPPAEHSLAPDDRSVEGLPVSVEERLDIPVTAHLWAATDFRKAGPNSGGSGALIYSLVEDLFSPPARTPDDPLGSDVYVPSGAYTPGEPVAPDHSTFDERYGGFPPGLGTTDEEMPDKVPWQYLDAEAFADLVNEVLVRQARRHGVDLS